MVRRRLLLAAIMACGLAVSSSPGMAAARSSGCGILNEAIGGCGTSVGSGIGNGQVDLGAGGTTPGGGGTRGNASGDGWTGGGDAPPPETPWCTPVFCRDGYTVTSALDERGPITWADLASFRPVAGTVLMEPAGWSIVGLETNLYADTVEHEIAGELAGLPAVVRFTPVGYRWDYGDGSSATTRQRGASWTGLGGSEFSPTSTSHVFERAGTFGLRSSVVFRAEYRFGPAAWVPVAGTLAVPLSDQTVVVGRAATVLVGQDCRGEKAGPGC